MKRWPRRQTPSYCSTNILCSKSILGVLLQRPCLSTSFCSSLKSSCTVGKINASKIDSEWIQHALQHALQHTLQYNVYRTNCHSHCNISKRKIDSEWTRDFACFCFQALMFFWIFVPASCCDVLYRYNLMRTLLRLIYMCVRVCLSVCMCVRVYSCVYVSVPCKIIVRIVHGGSV